MREFVALSEQLNFSKAAESLNMSQPALSNHILALEKELGVQLFNRNRRKVMLTQEGELILPEAQRMLSIFKNMHRFEKGNLAENQVITVGGYLDSPDILGLLAMRVKDYGLARGSNLKLLFDYDPLDDLEQKLIDRHLDFIVAYNNCIPNAEALGISTIPFHSDPYAVVLNKSNPLAEREFLSLDDLKDLFFIKLSNPVFEAGWQQIVDTCVEHGFKPKYHSLYVRSLNECAFAEVGTNKCFIFASGGFSGGTSFLGRSDLAVVPLVDECFSINLFYNAVDMHPLIVDFVSFLAEVNEAAA